MPLPTALVNAFLENRAAKFVGAGASMAAGLPSWDELIRRLAAELKITLPGQLDQDTLLKIPQYFENRSNRRELMRCVEDLLEQGHKQFLKTTPVQHHPVHHCLAQLPTMLYYTTNVDHFMEDELKAQGIEHNVIDSETMALKLTERRRCQVRKLHGTIGEHFDWDNIVLTRSDYASLPLNRPTIFKALAEDLKSHVFLFVGYSLRDPDFSSLYNNEFFAMRGKQQSHFLALLDDPGKHEINDLQLRGLVPVEVWNYAGSNNSQKLLSFLDLLVDATSEQVHLRRFYRGLKHHDHMSIVVTSRLHERESYVYYPASDIHTADQIKQDLQKLRVTADIVADEYALKNSDRLLSDNVVLVCSPFGNRFTKYVFEHAKRLKKEFAIQGHFGKFGDQRFIETADGRRFSSDSPTAKRVGERTEYGLIARYRNPWAPGKYIFLFAGLQALGTEAIGEFIKRPHGYRQLNEKSNDDDIVVILPVMYDKYDPFDYKFELGELIHVS